MVAILLLYFLFLLISLHKLLRATCYRVHYGYHRKHFSKHTKFFVAAEKHFNVVVSFIFLLVSTVCSAQTNITNPDSSKLYFLKAKQAREARKVWEAEKYYKQAIAFDPENTILQLEFADYYCDQRKYFLANPLFASVLKKEPKNTIAIQKSLEIAFLLRKWEDAISFAEIATANGINVDRLNFIVGKSYYEQEDYGKARTYLTLQKNQTPTDKETIALLGRVLIDLKKYQEATEVYKACIQLMPDNADVLYDLASLYSIQNKNADAIKYFELSAAKGMKQDIAFLENLGMCYLEVDIYKGVEILNRVLAKKPDDETCLTAIGRAYFNRQKFDLAYDYYYKVYNADKTNYNALYMTGVSLIRMGNKQKGEEICNFAISKNPALAKQVTIISNLK